MEEAETVKQLQKYLYLWTYQNCETFENDRNIFKKHEWEKHIGYLEKAFKWVQSYASTCLALPWRA